MGRTKGMVPVKYLLALLFTVGCSAPEGFAWGESPKAIRACEVWSAAAEYWQGVDIVCTPDAGVEVHIGRSVTRAWLVETPQEGGELLGLGHYCGVHSIEVVQGCAGPLQDAFVVDGPCAIWAATHELGHVLGHSHEDATTWPVMAPTMSCRSD